MHRIKQSRDMRQVETDMLSGYADICRTDRISKLNPFIEVKVTRSQNIIILII